MISQSGQSAFTLASNSGLSNCSYRVVWDSGSSRAIFLPPSPSPPELSELSHAAAPSASTTAAAAATLRRSVDTEPPKIRPYGDGQVSAQAPMFAPSGNGRVLSSTRRNDLGFVGTCMSQVVGSVHPISTSRY